MPFPPLTTNGLPNPDACVVMALGVDCTYTADINTLTQLGSMFGQRQITQLVHQPQSWPPNWIIFDDGRTLTIFADGTANIQQIVGDVAGCYQFAMPGTDGYAHGFFLNAAYAIWLSMQQHIPASILATRNYVLAGHSLGASTLSILSVIIRQNYPNASVGMINFAAPRSMTTEITSQYGAIGYNIVRQNDIVPLLPSRRSQFLMQLVTYPQSIYSTTSDWGNLQPRLRVNGLGAYPAEETLVNLIANAPSVQQMADAHNMDNYLADMVSYWNVWKTSEAIAPVITLVNNRAPTPDNLQDNIIFDPVTLNNENSLEEGLFSNSPNIDITPLAIQSSAATDGQFNGLIAGNSGGILLIRSNSVATPFQGFKLTW